MIEQLDELKKTVYQYIEDVDDWLKLNKLTVLPSYQELKNKEVWGTNYREDQNYYEIVAEFKSTVFGFKGYVTKMKIDVPVRMQNLYDSFINYLDEKTKSLEQVLSVAKQRLKFYQDIQYVISNMTYGNF